MSHGSRAELSDDVLRTVAAALAQAGEPVAAPLDYTFLAGGRSNLTFRIGDGVSDWIVRMPPRHGKTPSAHDVGREFRIAKALFATSVPVPRPIAFVEADAAPGSPFAVFEHCPGQSIQTRDQLEQLSEAEISSVSEHLVRVLATLHGIDFARVGLAGLGRPDGYAERQLKRWSGQWAIVGDPRLSRLGEEAVGGLVRGLPLQQPRTSIVHGDYRIDNVLVVGTESSDDVMIRAVLDWELSTLGDPVADVATMCAYRNPAFDLVLGFPTAWASPRLPTSDRLAASYEAASATSLTNWSFHISLAHYKIAVIAAGIAHRDRAAGGVDPRLAGAVAAVEPFLQESLRLIRTQSA